LGVLFEIKTEDSLTFLSAGDLTMTGSKQLATRQEVLFTPPSSDSLLLLLLLLFLLPQLSPHPPIPMCTKQKCTQASKSEN